MSRTRVVIMGAAGRDFHDFNVVYRDDPERARSSPSRRRRSPASPIGRYPPELAGPLYHERRSRSCPRRELERLIRERARRHGRLRLQRRPPRDRDARRVAGPGGRRRLQPARARRGRCSRAAARSSPSGATRTGAGKSQTTRYLAALLADAGPDAGRHPPPDALRRPRRAARPALRDATPTSTATRPRSRSARSTSRTSTPGASSTPASTTRRSSARPRARPTSSSGTAATTTSRSTGRTCYIVVADPLRPGDERRYHPGETNVRMADVVDHQQGRLGRAGRGRRRPRHGRGAESAGRGSSWPART